MAVKIGSNTSALVAQRRLAESTASLSATSERLSSGLRINRGADDAAGLQIAEGLRRDSKVYNQAIRNVNDGISLLNIAQGAVQQLSGIVTRHAELAEQAINGVYSNKQRRALDAEADALVKEYNRIVQTTSFNGTSTLSGVTNALRLQFGYGANGGIDIGVGSKLGFAASDGLVANFGYHQQLDQAGSFIQTADFNNDGILDALSGYGGQNITVSLGNGDGTFRVAVSYEMVTMSYVAAVGDVNGDGVVDVIANTDTGFSVLIGNGNGTLKAAATYSGNFLNGGYYGQSSIKDLNGDGYDDFVYTSGTELNVYLANANGTFQAGRSFFVGITTAGLQVADFNNDGVNDIASTDAANGWVNVILGNGNGTFRAAKTYVYSLGAFAFSIDTADFNGDGILDIAAASYGSQSIEILLGNADGSFRSSMSTVLDFAYAMDIHTGDVNGDGIVDLVTLDRDTAFGIITLLGNGDGTFRNFSTTPLTAVGISLADLNNDGMLDILGVAGEFNIYLANADSSGRRNNYLNAIDLTTKTGAKAALASSRAALSRIGQELGALGAIQSRLDTAAATLAVSRENFDAARSQLVDADVAQESAALVRTKILQQAATAVLSQANQQPALALKLLGGSRES